MADNDIKLSVGLDSSSVDNEKKELEKNVSSIKAKTTVEVMADTSKAKKEIEAAKPNDWHVNVTASFGKASGMMSRFAQRIKDKLHQQLNSSSQVIDTSKLKIPAPEFEKKDLSLDQMFSFGAVESQVKNFKATLGELGLPEEKLKSANALLAEFELKIRKGTATSSDLTKFSATLSETVKGFGGADLDAISAPFNALTNEIQGLADKLPASTEEAKDAVLASLADVSAKAATLGDDIRIPMEKAIEGLKGVASSADASDQSIADVAKATQLLLSTAVKLPPKSWAEIEKPLKKTIVNSATLRQELLKLRGEKLKIEVDGIDNLDVIERKIEAVANITNLDDGLDSLKEALKGLPEGKAKAIADEIDSLKKKLESPIDASSAKEIESRINRLGNSIKSLSQADIERIGPQFQTVTNAARAARQTIDSTTQDAQRLGELGSQAARVFSGDLSLLKAEALKAASGIGVVQKATQALSAAMSKFGGWIAVIAAVIAGIMKALTVAKRLNENAAQTTYEKLQKELADIEHKTERINAALDNRNSILEKELQLYKDQVKSVNDLASAQEENSKWAEMAAAATEEERKAIEARAEASATSREYKMESGILQKEQDKTAKTLTNERARLTAMESQQSQKKDNYSRQEEQLNRFVKAFKNLGGKVDISDSKAIVQSFDQRAFEGKDESYFAELAKSAPAELAASIGPGMSADMIAQKVKEYAESVIALRKQIEDDAFAIDQQKLTVKGLENTNTQLQSQIREKAVRYASTVRKQVVDAISAAQDAWLAIDEEAQKSVAEANLKKDSIVYSVSGSESLIGTKEITDKINALLKEQENLANGLDKDGNKSNLSSPQATQRSAQINSDVEAWMKILADRASSSQRIAQDFQRGKEIAIRREEYDYQVSESARERTRGLMSAEGQLAQSKALLYGEGGDENNVIGGYMEEMTELQNKLLIEQKRAYAAQKRDTLGDKFLTDAERLDLQAVAMTNEEYRKLSRDLNYLSGKIEQNKNAVTQLTAQLQAEKEDRDYSINIENEDYEENRRMKRMGNAGQLVYQKQLKDTYETQRREAQLLLDDNGRLNKLAGGNDTEDERHANRSKLTGMLTNLGLSFSDEEIDKVMATGSMSERMKSLVSQRYSRARGKETSLRDQIDDKTVERENREASFKEDIGKESNRLTQMGLGGGATVDWQRNQARDIHEMVGLSKEHLKALRDLRGGNSQRIGITSTTWTMK